MRFMLLTLLLCAGMAWADDVPSSAQAFTPAVSLDRLSIGVRGEYSWFAQRFGVPPTEFDREYAVGMVGSYNLVPNCSLIGGSVYGVKNRLFRSWLGVNVIIFRGKGLK